MNKAIHNLVKSKVSFTVNEILPRIYHLEFNSRKDLASTLMRFQEHYESPRFKGECFELDEFIRWYKSTRHGKFSYFTDWSGFNFPSKTLAPFKKGEFKNISTREAQVLELFKSGRKFYIIGTFKSQSKRLDISTKNHEIAHALFYLNPEYKKKVLKCLKNVNLNPIFKFLKKEGYHPDVFLDEAHAYLMADSKDLLIHGILVYTYRHTVEELQRIYHTYSNG
jgi:hypothetical protein